MLSKLIISNYALINHLEIDFNKGLSIITGETGAGKSIILGALSLILGERIDLKVIRNTEKKAIIEVVFDISKYNLKSFFSNNNLDWNDNELILRREVAINGRSRAFINDTPVNLNVLRELSIKLVDIHSQHQNLLLADSKYQLQIIDALADNEQLRIKYKEQFKKYINLISKQRKLEESISRNNDEEEYLKYQYDLLKKIDLKEGEISELEKLSEILNSAEEIRYNLSMANSKISQSDNSILALIKESIKTLSHVNFSLFTGVNEESDSLLKRLENTYIELKDISETIEQYLSNVDVDPQLLEHTTQRLDTLYETQRKFRVSSEAELIELKEDIERKLVSIVNSDEEISELKEKVKIEGKTLIKLATELTETRQNAAKNFSDLLINMARPLGMRNIKFIVRISKGKLNSEGQDIIEFLCSFNKNQELMPISKVASGGEMSRIMLCVKNIVAAKIQLPTIIFDEVDTGVSGEIADKMGDMMKRISESIQVLTITHLPQVAAKGDFHYKVFKSDAEDFTYTSIQELNDNERINEIAQMLSGSTINDAAILNAKSLLKK